MAQPESQDGTSSSTVRNIEKIRKAVEVARVILIEEDEEGPGVLPGPAIPAYNMRQPVTGDKSALDSLVAVGPPVGGRLMDKIGKQNAHSFSLL